MCDEEKIEEGGVVYRGERGRRRRRRRRSGWREQLHSRRV